MSKVYYKATRPDGTDFYSGTVLYAVGKQLPELPKHRGTALMCCTGNVYHAASVPAETLVGGSWPCRLFEVTGTPVDSVGQKHGFVTFKVEREIEAWRALGPNGQEVVKILDQAETTTREQVRALATQSLVGNTARRKAWRRALHSARDAAFHAAACAPASGEAYTTGYMARYVLRDALQGTVVKDLITPEEYEIFSKSWFEVMGDPT